MGVGSFLAGSIPLSINLAQDKLDMVATFGAGLLIGAVFLIIIPEGVETVYKSSSSKILRTDVLPSTQSEEQEIAVEHSIGLAMLIGFAFMFVIDQNLHSHEHTPIPISVSDLRDYNSEVKSTPTLGLVIHGMADGVAMGSAFVSDHRELEWVLFFAILIHKAPTSFGLTTFLLQKGLPKQTVRKHIGKSALTSYFC